MIDVGIPLELLAILVIVQAVLAVTAAIIWLHTDAALLPGNKFAWLLVILLVGIVGPTIFLIIVIRERTRHSEAPPEDQRAGETLSDLLYPETEDTR